MPEISVLVEGGKATAGAPLGPALGPTGVNIGEVVAKINEKTKGFAGTKVPVKVIVDPAKKCFEVEVGSPPMSALIKKELNIQKAVGNPKTEVAGSLSMEQVKKIAQVKMENINSYELYSAVREVIGTANSMGVQIDGKHAKEVQKEFEEGKFNSVFGREALESGVKKEVESFAEGMAEAAKDLVGEKEQIKEEVEKAVQGVAKELGMPKKPEQPKKTGKQKEELNTSDNDEVLPNV